jgi:hypothetical protein
VGRLPCFTTPRSSGGLRQEGEGGAGEEADAGMMPKLPFSDDCLTAMALPTGGLL